MRPLIKVMLVLASIFASTFVAGRLLGILTEENIRLWLTQASEASPWWIAATVIALLTIDLFVAVPTLTVTILAGYFLGFQGGLLAAFTGTALAASTGYSISRLYGDNVLARLVKQPERRAELRTAFLRDGPAMILLSRAAPILPEVTACMAGATRMRVTYFALLFSASTLPYVTIAAYAGSVSTFENPMPAIYAAICLYGVMWAGWAWYRKAITKAP